MKKGFTLVELMIVISVMGLIAAIAVPFLVNVKQGNNVDSDGNNIIVKVDAKEAERNRYQVNYMFEVDGVKMYRFYEGGNNHYFTIGQTTSVLEKNDQSK
jgi:prepilin-type N-terminal cleavage/methylation domain-containing protein